MVGQDHETPSGGEPELKRQRTDAGGAWQQAEQQPSGSPYPKQLSKREKRDNKKVAKKKHYDTPEGKLGLALVDAVKGGRVEEAIQLFDQSKEGGMKLQLHTYNSMLFIFTGVESWDAYVGTPGLADRIPKQPHNVRLSKGEKPEGTQPSADPSQPPADPKSDTPAAEAAASSAAPAAGAGGAEGGGASEGQAADTAAAGTSTGEQAVADDGEQGPEGDGGQKRQPKWKKGDSSRVLMSEELKARACDAAEGVWARMQELGMAGDEVTFTALARLAAIRGNYEEAVRLGEQATEAGKAVKLRNFLPALMGFADTGNVEGALKIDARIAEAGVDLTETEYALLLEAVCKGGSYEQMAGLLQRLSKELNELAEQTLAIIRQFFESSPAALAPFQEGGTLHGRGEGRWQLLRTEVQPDGSCEAAGGKLEVIDLETEEWRTFGRSIADLASSKERGDNFKQYKEWFERNGPYDIMLDAANIAFYGQNRDGGGFCWAQIGAMVDAVRAQHPRKKLLVMLHVKRLRDPEANTPEAQRLIADLQASKSFYYTPKGSNDDWYWMYATVCSGRSAMLISNDELRDHIFQLLRPKHFLKWKERHIIHYSFDMSMQPTLVYPPKYTPCVQNLAASGAWMFPSVAGDWLCARVAGASGDAPGQAVTEQAAAGH